MEIVLEVEQRTAQFISTGIPPNPQGQLRWRLTNALRNELLEKRIYVCNNWGKGMILHVNNVVSYD